MSKWNFGVLGKCGRRGPASIAHVLPFLGNVRSNKLSLRAAKRPQKQPSRGENLYTIESSVGGPAQFDCIQFCTLLNLYVKL